MGDSPPLALGGFSISTVMHPAVLRALEFDRIVEAVRGFAFTPMGDERLARLQPSTDPQKVAQLLAATTEAVTFITRQWRAPAAGGGRPAARF